MNLNELYNICSKEYNIPVINLHAQNAGEDTILHIACTRSINEVIYLLEECNLMKYINWLGDSSFTPLHYAAFCNKYDIYEYLIAKGANPNIKNGWVDKAETYFTNHDDCIKNKKNRYEKEIEETNNNNLKNYYKDMLKSCFLDYVESFNYKSIYDENGILNLLELYEFSRDNYLIPVINVTAENANGDTILHVAATRNLDEVDYMMHYNEKSSVPDDFDLDMKQYCNFLGTNNMSPLHYAGKFKKHDVYEYLISKGSDPNLRDSLGNTAEDWLNKKD